MIYLLDTNALSDLVREQPTLVARLASHTSPDQVVTCTIALGEILHGIRRLPVSRRRMALETKSAGVLKDCRCEPVPATAAEHYASIKSELQRVGLPLDENDLWIAATALALGASIVTRDRHFQRVPGLTVEDWSS